MGLRRSARSHLPKIIPAPFYFDVETVRQHTNTYSECVYPGSAGGGGLIGKQLLIFKSGALLFGKGKILPRGAAYTRPNYTHFFVLDLMTFKREYCLLAQNGVHSTSEYALRARFDAERCTPFSPFLSPLQLPLSTVQNPPCLDIVRLPYTIPERHHLNTVIDRFGSF